MLPLDNLTALQLFLDDRVNTYNQPAFIPADPIAIPHQFTQLQDIEIAGFFAAIFSWGNRQTIINKSNELMQRMDKDPFRFVMHHTAKERMALVNFKHRTFQTDDLFYFLEFLQMHYQLHNSLETAFSQWMRPEDETVEQALIGFKQYFFSLEHLPRTQKHISSPAQGSSCKRLNMFLRWMVRKDTKGVDFGCWSSIQPAQLVCPMDVHVARVAKRIGFMERKIPDWQAALALTEFLRKLDASDPIKYDFALFGLGVIEKYG